MGEEDVDTQRGPCSMSWELLGKTFESAQGPGGALAQATSIFQEMILVLTLEGWVEAGQKKKSGKSWEVILWQKK